MVFFLCNKKCHNLQVLVLLRKERKINAYNGVKTYSHKRKKEKKVFPSFLLPKFKEETKMKYGYCRVSTKGQLDGNSIEEQRNLITNLYPDAEIIVESYSGAKVRPIFNEVLGKSEIGDIIAVTKLDRFCRSTKEGLEYIDLLMNKGVKIHILNMGLIENNAMGRLIVTNLLAFAEFERAMILERTQGGKAIAKMNPNFREGRPKKFSRKQIKHALELLESNSYKQVEELTGISKSTLIRAKRTTDFV